MRCRIVQGNAFEAFALEGVPQALGIVGAAVKRVDAFTGTYFDAPTRDTVRAGVRASGEGCPVGGCPDREGGKGFVDCAFVEHAFESWENAFVGKIFHHGGDEAIHAVGDDFF